MDALWLVAFVSAVLTVVVAVVRPLLGPRVEWYSAEESELDSLLQEKARLLRALKDLDHELAGGFLHEDEFRETRRDYMEQAARLNRDLQRLTGLSPARRPREAGGTPEERGGAPKERKNEDGDGPPGGEISS